MSLNEILGMNARNFSFVREYNSRETIRLVDNKLKTKKALREAGLPVPGTYKVFRRSDQVRKFDFSTLPNSFVVKPNSGFGGKGIMVVYGKTKTGFLRSDGGLVTFDEIKLHILDILEGVYSLSGLPDVAYIEERIKSDKRLKRFSFKGLADIRIINFNMVPVMAMLRLPTVYSRGRANLHEGALGVQIDLNSGITDSGFWQNKPVKFFPGTKNKINGIKIPFWEEILTLSSQAQEVIGSSYLGVDVTISKEMGPVILELNARPGLSIQNVNNTGLKERLEKLKGVKPVLPSSAAALGRELFGKLKEITSPFVSNKPVLGLVEQVKILANKKIIGALAKIDTGADSSAIDFTIAQQLGFEKLVAKMKNADLNYRTKEELAQKIKKLKTEIESIIDILELKAVRSATGRQIRAKIKIKFKVAGKLVESEAYLADRSNLDFPVILGKDVLEYFLVDPLKYVSSSHKFKIKTTNDSVPFFGLMPKKLVGLSVCAIDRIGVFEWLKRGYKIISLRSCQEDHLLDLFFNLKINSLEKVDPQVYKQVSNLETLLLSPKVNGLNSSLHNANWLVSKSSPLIEKMASQFKSKVLANSFLLAKKVNKIFNRKEFLTKSGIKFLEKEESTNLGDSYLKIIGCVTKYGTFYSYPQRKLKDKNNQFIGLDFNFEADKNLLTQIRLLIEKINVVLMENKYKGIFSLNLLWDEKKKTLLLQKFTSTLPPSLSVQFLLKREDLAPLLLWHILEFMRAPYEVDFSTMQNQYLNGPIGGGYLEMYNNSDNYLKILKAPKVGIYEFINDQVLFKKADFRAPLEGEILFAGGVPHEGSVVRPKSRLGRIIFRQKIDEQKIPEQFLNLYQYQKIN
ncbi:MAG: sugar-transfer associated ATP-grasp domain-containing protein [Patescibacteria group bacterium]|nr:sugar-transfer associated ATP-grasp domain-containing protein [Patescibacteria group bacterium]